MAPMPGMMQAQMPGLDPNIQITTSKDHVNGVFC